jgi:hypothetical protein
MMRRTAISAVLALGVGLATACVDEALLEENDSTDDGGPDLDSDTWTVEDPVADVTVFAEGIALDWAFSIGGEGYDMITDTVPLDSGDVIVSGFFSSTVVFGEDKPTETTLVAGGDHDIFLARYTGNGELVWARQAGSNLDQDFEEMGTLVLAGEDGVVFCGTVGAEAIFGPGEENETVVGAEDAQTAVIARYDVDGSLEWAREVAVVSYGTGPKGARCLPLAESGFVMTGLFDGTCVFGTGQQNEVEISTVGNEDGFLAWLDTDGTMSRVLRIGSAGYDSMSVWRTNPDGTVVAGGTIGGATVFGEGGEDEVEVEPVGSADAFVAAFGAEGDLLWVNRLGGPGSSPDNSSGIGGPDGSTVVSCWYSGLATVDSLGVATASVGGGDGGVQILLARYSAEGELDWVSHFADGGSSCWASPLWIPEDGSILMTGAFEQAVVFDPESPLTTQLEACDHEVDVSHDFFIALVDAEGDLAWARREGGPYLDASIGSALGSDGSLFVHGYFGEWQLQASTAIGVGDPNETFLESNGYFDSFLARYSAR